MCMAGMSLLRTLSAAVWPHWFLLSDAFERVAGWYSRCISHPTAFSMPNVACGLLQLSLFSFQVRGSVILWGHTAYPGSFIRVTVKFDTGPSHQLPTCLSGSSWKPRQIHTHTHYIPVSWESWSSTKSWFITPNSKSNRAQDLLWMAD